MVHKVPAVSRDESKVSYVKDLGGSDTPMVEEQNFAHSWLVIVNFHSAYYNYIYTVVRTVKLWFSQSVRQYDCTSNLS